MRFSDVDRRIFCTLERLVVYDLVKATELTAHYMSARRHLIRFSAISDGTESFESNDLLA